MIDQLIAAAGLIGGGFVLGWITCRVQLHRIVRRKIDDLDRREADLCQREQDVTAAEQNARRAADALRPYTQKSAN